MSAPALTSDIHPDNEGSFVNSAVPSSDGSYETSFLGKLPSDMLPVISSFLNQESFNSLRLTSKYLDEKIFLSPILEERKATFVIKNREQLNKLVEMLDSRPEFNIIPVEMTYKGVTDEDLSHLSNVTSVNLCYCFSITDAGLVHLSSATSVNLCYCTQITDEGLELLINLKRVNLRGSYQITEETK